MITLPQQGTWLPADTQTPISLYLTLVRDKQGFLLESTEVDGRLGRYSLIGWDYRLILSCVGGKLDVLSYDPRLHDLKRFSGQDYVPGLRACLGDLTGTLGDNGAVLRRIRREGLIAIQGEGDWARARGSESVFPTPPDPEEWECFLGLPQVAVFHLADRKAVGFFGAYLQALPGFSDFEPYALEMNMVCNLTRFLQDEEVFPALESMTPQFGAQVVLFSQPRRWAHWRIGGVDFISVGPARSRGWTTTRRKSPWMNWRT